MIITYQGDNYFKLQSGQSSILIDPTDQRSFKGANLILNTEKPSVTEDPGQGVAFWIDHAGEYEVGDVRIRSWHAGFNKADNKKKTIHRIDFEDFRFLILGALGSEIGPELQEHFTNIDVVLTLINGKSQIGHDRLAKFIRQFEPGLIIPSGFTDKNLTSFLNEFGQKDCTKEEKIVIKKKDIKDESMQIRCLKL